MGAYDQPNQPYLIPSENTVAIHIAQDGEISASQQVISYIQTDGRQISGYFSLNGDHKLDYVGIFATRGSFNVKDTRRNHYKHFISIDDFIEYLENMISINADELINSRMLGYDYIFDLLSKITGMEYDRDNFQSVQKQWQKHVGKKWKEQ